MTILTLRRGEARAHAIILAVVAWSILAVGYIAPGDRTAYGLLKWPDFPQFYVMGVIARTLPAETLYDAEARYNIQVASVPASDGDRFQVGSSPPPYPPLLASVFVLFSLLPYTASALLWSTVSLIVLLAVIELIVRTLELDRSLGRSFIYPAVLAFPATWQLFAHGQTSIVPLLAFVGSWIALRSNRQVVAGAALGFLLLKPQFGLGVAAVAFAASQWRIIGGAILSVAGQAALTIMLFGPKVVAVYAGSVLNAVRFASASEPKPYMQHSLRVLTSMFPGRLGMTVLLVTSLAVVFAVVRIWKNCPDPHIRTASLVLGSMLVNPHLYVYDAVLLLPVALWLGFAFCVESEWLWKRAYLLTALFVFPTSMLFAPLQLSVIGLVELLWQVMRRVLGLGVSGGEFSVVTN